MHANELATALQRTSLSFRSLLLAGHSQTGHLKHQGDLCPWHRKNHLPAATALPSLAMTFTDPITFLEGVTPRAVSPCVMGSRPCTVSAEAFLPRFLGAEHRSTPLPAGERFSQSGTVFGSTHWQALSGLSWLSYSPPCFSQGRRVWSFTRSLPVTRQGAPHASRVERARLRP